jgi:hypothetical protein
MRAYEAYVTPSGIFTGMALYEVASAILILVQIPNKETLLWRASLITCNISKANSKAF